MKKYLGIVCALVLAVSLLMMPAAPVAAAPGDVELQTVGNATAEYSTEQAYSLDYSVKLYVENGEVDWAEVSIPVDIAIEEIYDLSFWEYIDSYSTKGNVANVNLGIDCDGDGFEADVAAWHLTHDPEVLGNDTFLVLERTECYGTWAPGKGTWNEVDLLGTLNAWSVKVDGVSWQDGANSLTEVVENLPYGRIESDDRVKVIQIVIGGSGNWLDETAYVDDITINGVLYDLEPSAVVGVTAVSEEAEIGLSVSPTFIDFQDITSGLGVSGQALTVSNIGNVPITVDAEIIADTFFDEGYTEYFYTAALRLSGSPSNKAANPTSFGSWAHLDFLGDGSIEVKGYKPVATALQCPSPINADTTYTGTVVFWAEQQ